MTLLNPGTEAVDLAGWSLIDRQGRMVMLDAMIIPPGEAVRLTLMAPLQLGNNGGLLTLLNPAGLKVDGIAYTRDQARAEGRTLVF